MEWTRGLVGEMAKELREQWRTLSDGGTKASTNHLTWLLARADAMKGAK